MKLIHAAIGAALTLAAPASAQTGDAAIGAELAVEYCARCHDVAAGGAFKTFPPSFASIAAFRGPDQIVARIWFPATHSLMPQMMNLLSREDVDNLTAYIVSLETAQ